MQQHLVTHDAILKEQVRAATQQAVESLTTLLPALIRSSLDAPSTGASATIATTSAAASAQPDIRSEIQALIASRQFVAALDKALCASDLQLLSSTCRQIGDPALVFSQSISQGVLLAFIQQIAFDLTSADADLKIQWLKEALLMLDPKDGVIQHHVGPILGQVLANLKTNFPTDPSSPQLQNWRLTIHIVNSLRK